MTQFQHGRPTLPTMRDTKKEHLPQKTCPVCQRPFVWRKKWAKNWDDIKYCSERCRRRRNQ
ncbi:MAG: DUF2256 domain-containing protein [Anaerolineales bacterium]|nr:DUF2256 domain-containing protein [Anaerolineales bacterium]